MTALHFIELPDALAMAVQRASVFRTDIVESGSGVELRNAGQFAARRRFELDTGPRPLAELRRLAHFFEARRGRHYGFLLRDWLDPHSGAGDAPGHQDTVLRRLDARHYALCMPLREIEDAANAASHAPVLPVADTLLLAQDGTPLETPRDFFVDAPRGLIIFTRDMDESTRITAGFHFYVPVRFDADALEINRLSADMARLKPLPLIEIRLSAITQFETPASEAGQP